MSEKKKNASDLGMIVIRHWKVGGRRYLSKVEALSAHTLVDLGFQYLEANLEALGMGGADITREMIFSYWEKVYGYPSHVVKRDSATDKDYVSNNDIILAKREVAQEILERFPDCNMVYDLEQTEQKHVYYTPQPHRDNDAIQFVKP